MRERFKFRRVNEITGIFVIGILLLVIAGIAWTASSQRWFKSAASLRIAFPEEGAAGIRQGSEVYFLGTLVGSVSDVIVAPTGRMEARVRIRRDFFLFVRSDSSAIVKKKFGVAGDSFFEITRGVGKPLPEANASIVCNEQFQSQFESAIEEIRSAALLTLKKATIGLDVWTKLGDELRETRGRVDQLAQRWDSVSENIENGKGAVGKLLTDEALVNDTLKLLADARNAVSESRSMMTNLNAAVQSVQTGAAKFPEIGNALADEAKDLPGLVQQTKTSMIELERLILAAQQHWLVRKYVDKPAPAKKPAVR
jgi:phospholipid/cholesterol/gamma-HCH transport system substrate-binding protein